MNIDIRSESGHYVVKINGEIFCRADTYGEAIQELIQEGFIQLPNSKIVNIPEEGL